MRKFALFACIGLSIAGCQTIEERRAEIDRADDQRCQQYGARRGTQAYIQCRTDLDRNRAIETANRRPVVVQTIGVGPVYRPVYGPGFCRPTPWGVRCY
jgi:hypothetical protein